MSTEDPNGDTEAVYAEAVERLRRAGQVTDGADQEMFRQAGPIGGHPPEPTDELPEGLVEPDDGAEEDIFAGIDRVDAVVRGEEDEALRALSRLYDELGYEGVRQAIAEADAEWVYDAALRRAFGAVEHDPPGPPEEEDR